MRLSRAKRSEANVDLTPMIDVVLLLVIFFMFTTHIARTQYTPIDLPQEEGEKAREPGSASITIDLTADGRILMRGDAADLESLTREVERERAAGVDLEIVVRADRSASAVHLNSLADTLARAGIRNWELATAGGGQGEGVR